MSSKDEYCYQHVFLVLPPVLVPPQVHNDIPIERPSLDEYELPANANYPVGPEPVMPLPLSLPGNHYVCLHHDNVAV